MQRMSTHGVTTVSFGNDGARMHLDHKAIIGVAENPAVRALVSGQGIPVGGVGAVVAIVGIPEGIALFRQVVPDPLGEGAGAAELAPVVV